MIQYFVDWLQHALERVLARKQRCVWLEEKNKLDENRVEKNKMNKNM